jgi:outer membrane protein OmpA-like peptidoglycan-associated protein
VLKDINAIDKNALIEKLDARKVHINMSMQELTFGAIDTAKLDALALPLPPIKIDDRRQYRQQLNNINSHSFYFEQNATELNEKELAKIPLLVNAIKRIISLSNTLGLDEPQIMLLGFADANGSSGANFEVSRERAELVKALLINNGIQEKYIQAWGMGHKDGPLISANNQRRVSIHLLDQLSNAVPEGL